MNSKTHTFAAGIEYRSYNNTMNNELRVGYTRVRDNLIFGSTPFPYVKVKLIIYGILKWVRSVTQQPTAWIRILLL